MIGTTDQLTIYVFTHTYTNLRKQKRHHFLVIAVRDSAINPQVMAFLFILRYTELKCRCNQMYSVFEVYVLKKEK